MTLTGIEEPDPVELLKMDHDEAMRVLHEYNVAQVAALEMRYKQYEEYERKLAEQAAQETP